MSLINMTRDEKTPREMVDDVAEIPDDMVSQLPHWAQVLRDICREVRAQEPGDGRLEK